MERSVYTLFVVKLKGLREYIPESPIFSKFYLRVLFKMEYEDVVEIEVEHETQEELEIDLEDSEDEFIIDEEKSDYGIADSCYESDSDSDILNHAEVTNRLITRAEIKTLDGTNRMYIIYFYYLYTANHSSDRDKFCSSCIIRMHNLFLRLHTVRQHVISQYIHVDDMHCKKCRNPLYQILLCNLYPICPM